VVYSAMVSAVLQQDNSSEDGDCGCQGSWVDCACRHNKIYSLIDKHSITSDMYAMCTKLFFTDTNKVTRENNCTDSQNTVKP